jgi:hypothetical protein
MLPSSTVKAMSSAYQFAIGRRDLPRFQQMHERFVKLGLKIKADVIAAQTPVVGAACG